MKRNQVKIKGNERVDVAEVTDAILTVFLLEFLIYISKNYKIHFLK